MIQVNELTEALERLLENEFSYKAKDFIFKFRKPIGAIQAVEDPLEPQFDETGRSYVEYLGKLNQMGLIERPKFIISKVCSVFVIK